MKLLDAAEVEIKARGGWEQGWNGDPRGCGGVSIYIQDPCEPATTSDVVGTEADENTVDQCAYRVIPFGYVAEMRRNVRMAQEDDGAWLAKALKASSEIPVARGLLVQIGVAGRLGDTWIGNPEATQIAAPALTDQAAVGTAVGAARTAFFSKTIGVQPILHVSSAAATALVQADVVGFSPVDGEAKTIWGDPVVISEGYDPIPGMTALPVAFFTGPVKITLSDVNEEDVIQATRLNRVMFQASQIAAIDTLPCAIVRIGPAPAPVG